jgi:hypothetical protein
MRVIPTSAAVLLNHWTPGHLDLDLDLDDDDDDDDVIRKRKKHDDDDGGGGVFFSISPPPASIKLKCFSNFIVIGSFLVCLQLQCLFRFLVFINAVFVGSLASSGLHRLFVLSFRGITNFIVPVANFLFISSPLMFVRSFVNASNSICVCGMVNITIGRRIISTGFATVGFIFLLSKRFF